MPSRFFAARIPVTLAISLGALVSSPEARAQGLRTCVLSVTVDPENDHSRQKLRHILEQEIDHNAALTRVPYTKAIQVAVKKQLAPKAMTTAGNLYDIAVALDLDVALMVWSTPYGTKTRLVLAAIDPLDGSALAKASLKLSAATPGKAALRKLMTGLVRDIRARRTEELAEPPPPPPVR